MSLSANSDHLKTLKSESDLHLCGVQWKISSQFSSVKEMMKVHLSSQRSTPVRKPSASRMEENGFGKRVFEVAPFGSGQVFALVALELCVLGVPRELLQRVISQANRPNV